MFVRMCPYLPFSARVCLNQHHWLANRMREEGIRFQQCANAFLKCAAPKRLQELADSLTAQDLVSCGQKWLARLTPFFTRRERDQAGCQHRLFFSQVEYCDNLIFKRRAVHRRTQWPMAFSQRRDRESWSKHNSPMHFCIATLFPNRHSDIIPSQLKRIRG
jgi:hypothetical protein